jgi:hypothetical protein
MRYVLPKNTTVKKPRTTLVSDEYGFVVDPNLARELRDLKLELDCLPLSSKKRSPHLVARTATKLQKRIQEIHESLECPCPSSYRIRRHLPDGLASEAVQDGEIAQDKARIDSFRRRRAQKQIFTPQENLEEALVRGTRPATPIMSQSRRGDHSWIRATPAGTGAKVTQAVRAGPC